MKGPNTTIVDYADSRSHKEILTKLEVPNNLIKIMKRNAFSFRNFANFKKRILIALNIKKERTNFVLS